MFGRSLSHHMLNTDPPEHSRLRRLVNRAFTPRAVERLRPRAEQICADLLAGMAGRAEVDLLEAFAVPLPIRMICELLGVPAADRADFRGWSNTLVSALPADAQAGPYAAMSAYLHELIRAKRAAPTDDMLSALAAVTDGGDRLTEDELVAMAFLLLAAGHETTVNLIGNGMLALLGHPDQLAALRADRSRLPAAIEEFLRYDGPVNQATLRFTAAPVELGGARIPAGAQVFALMGAANRDGEIFTEPDRWDPHRDGPKHLAFGQGVHYCLGAQLAKMEAKVAITTLVEQLPDLTLAPGFTGEYLPNLMHRGPARLPVVRHPR
jgi:cytochrome P450